MVHSISTMKFRIICYILLIILSGSCRKTVDPALPPTTVTDIDGNVYHTVTIGSQVWLGENLRVTRFNDGTTIPGINDSTLWGKQASPAFCWYNNDESNKTTYGALYNWHAGSSGKLAPKGWHVPSDAELTQLITFCGGEKVAGGILKEKGTTHWGDPNTGAVNEFGFSALPGGYRAASGGFVGIGYVGYMWCTTTYVTGALYREMSNSDGEVRTNNNNKEFGYSIRCIRD
jgi:uncharacterized protein (TIGR02145 family)